MLVNKINLFSIPLVELSELFYRENQRQEEKKRRVIGKKS